MEQRFSPSLPERNTYDLDGEEIWVDTVMEGNDEEDDDFEAENNRPIYWHTR